MNNNDYDGDSDQDTYIKPMCTSERNDYNKDEKKSDIHDENKSDIEDDKVHNTKSDITEIMDYPDTVLVSDNKSIDSFDSNESIKYSKVNSKLLEIINYFIEKMFLEQYDEVIEKISTLEKTKDYITIFYGIAIEFAINNNDDNFIRISSLLDISQQILLYKNVINKLFKLAFHKKNYYDRCDYVEKYIIYAKKYAKILLDIEENNYNLNLYSRCLILLGEIESAKYYVDKITGCMFTYDFTNFMLNSQIDINVGVDSLKSIFKIYENHNLCDYILDFEKECILMYVDKLFENKKYEYLVEMYELLYKKDTDRIFLFNDFFDYLSEKIINALEDYNIDMACSFIKNNEYCEMRVDTKTCFKYKTNTVYYYQNIIKKEYDIVEKSFKIKRTSCSRDEEQKIIKKLYDSYLKHNLTDRLNKFIKNAHKYRHSVKKYIMFMLGTSNQIIENIYLTKNSYQLCLQIGIVLNILILLKRYDVCKTVFDVFHKYGKCGRHCNCSKILLIDSMVDYEKYLSFNTNEYYSAMGSLNMKSTTKIIKLYPIDNKIKLTIFKNILNFNYQLLFGITLLNMKYSIETITGEKLNRGYELRD